MAQSCRAAEVVGRGEKVVGDKGFEPSTPSSLTKCANRTALITDF